MEIFKNNWRYVLFSLVVEQLLVKQNDPGSILALSLSFSLSRYEVMRFEKVVACEPKIVWSHFSLK